MLSDVEKTTAFGGIVIIVIQLYLHKSEIRNFSFKTKNDVMVDVNSNIENEVIFGDDTFGNDTFGDDTFGNDTFGNDTFGDESFGCNDILSDVNNVTDADLEEFHQNSSLISRHKVNKKCEGLCTAELLFDGKEIDYESDNFPWQKKDDDILEWRVTKEAQCCCQLRHPYLKPLQSSSDHIQNALEKKWLLMMGDSSVRMAFDYLIGRWVGSWKHWPDDIDSHGINPAKCSREKKCFSDVYVRGARVTFVWFSQDLNSMLQDFLSRQLGVPNVVVAEHGYWERGRKDEDYSLIYSESIPKQILEVLDMHELDEFYPKGFTLREKQRHMWMSAYDKTFFKRNKEVGEIIDGTHGAKESGWEIFDRSKLVDRNGKSEDAHPKDEALEIELELLVQIMKNIPIE